MILLDIGSPDIFLKIEAIQSQIKSGRNLYLMFELRNKHNYELKNVEIIAYDQCLFSGESKKEIKTLKPNQTLTWTWKWTSEKTDFDTVCNIKFKTSYEATVTWSQGIATLNQIEYEQRELSGTLKEIPIPSFYPDSPLGISITFSNEQPFLGNGEKEYMYIDYSNKGKGFINLESIKIRFPSNMGVTISNIVNESVNFAANDTYYQTSNMPLVGVLAVYCDAAHTVKYPTSAYAWDHDSGIKIYVNGTGSCPNVTTGIHYVDYYVYGEMNVSCDDYDSLGRLKKTLSFIKGRAKRSTCSFTPVAQKPIDVETLSLTATYKYVFDNSIIVRVLRS